MSCESSGSRPRAALIGNRKDATATCNSIPQPHLRDRIGSQTTPGDPIDLQARPAGPLGPAARWAFNGAQGVSC